MRIKNLNRGDRVRNVSFQVKCGERLGIAGLVGSGRTELLRTIFGADQADSGTIQLANATPRECFDHPRQAVRHGIALLTEDRMHDGLLLERPVLMNASLANLPHHQA